MLRLCRWNGELMSERWFSNETKLKYEAGITYDTNIEKSMDKQQMMTFNASKKQNNGGYCMVCYADFNASKKSGDKEGMPLELCCGHQFCQGCWRDWFLVNIDADSKKSLNTRCQQFGCNVIVPHSMFYKLFDTKNDDNRKVLNRYLRWNCQSFTDDNKNVKWCPYSKECDFAAQRISDYDTEHIVNCQCGNSFCFKCGQEQHWPSDCDMRKKWELKNSSESENLTWIIANTKMCPNEKCQRPIEKNQGCNHMTCKVCGADFCWMCTGPWKDHNQATGGYYKCNKYEEKNGNTNDPKVKERENAKIELQRYIFYFERFDNHNKAEKLARELRPVINNKIKMLHDLKQYPVKELEFLRYAIDETVKCRQVLKYTYCFGYLAIMNSQQRNLFEHQQNLLEEACELAHEQIERPLDPFLDPNIPDRSPFFKYKAELINLTNVTNKNCQALMNSNDFFTS